MITMKHNTKETVDCESAEERIKELEAEKGEIEKELEKLASRYARLLTRRDSKRERSKPL